MILIRKHLVALRQVGAAAIHEINDRQPVFEGNVLRAHVLLDGFLEKRSALGGGVVGDDHADHAADRANSGHQTGARYGIVVEAPGRKRGEFEKRAERVDQQIDPFTHRNLAAVAVALDHPVAATGERPGLPGPQRLQQAVIDRGVGLERLGLRVDRAAQCRHR